MRRFLVLLAGCCAALSVALPADGQEPTPTATPAPTLSERDCSKIARSAPRSASVRLNKARTKVTATVVPLAMPAECLQYGNRTMRVGAGLYFEEIRSYIGFTPYLEANPFDGASTYKKSVKVVREGCPATSPSSSRMSVIWEWLGLGEKQGNSKIHYFKGLPRSQLTGSWMVNYRLCRKLGKHPFSGTWGD